VDLISADTAQNTPNGIVSKQFFYLIKVGCLVIKESPAMTTEELQRSPKFNPSLYTKMTVYNRTGRMSVLQAGQNGFNVTPEMLQCR